MAVKYTLYSDDIDNDWELLPVVEKPEMDLDIDPNLVRKTQADDGFRKFPFALPSITLVQHKKKKICKEKKTW